MTPTVRRDWPRGFGGAVENHAALLSASDSVLRLPAQAVVDGPFLWIPEGEFDQIVVESFCEGFGTLEAFASGRVAGLGQLGTAAVMAGYRHRGPRPGIGPVGCVRHRREDSRKPRELAAH